MHTDGTSSTSPPVHTAPHLRSRLLAMMFTDLVGSTGLKDDIKTAHYLPLLRRHDELVREGVAFAGGQLQQDTGDGCFAVFSTPSDAVRAALIILEKLDAEPWPEGRRLVARVGIHLGEVAETEVRQDGGNKLVGLAVDMAARVMSLAMGGQILLTRGAFDDARQFVVHHPGAEPVSLRWLAHGPYFFKGSQGPQDVFEVGVEGRSPLVPPPNSEKARRAVIAGNEKTLGWRPAVGLPLPRAPQWVVDRKLRDSAFGEIWLARHAKIRSQRVFKFCFDANHLLALKREVVLLRLLKEALGDRRDISRVIDWQFDEPPYFIEMDYAHAGNLAGWAAGKGGLRQLPLEQRVKIMSQAATALAAAHSVGVLHKDIGPENIMMVEEAGVPYPRLSDFGIGILTDEARLKDYFITAAGVAEPNIEPGEASRTGARMYAPPESLANKPHTVQGDVYALGVLLYQMVVGDLERPLGVGWERDVNDEALRQVIASSVDFDPARRLATAAILAQRLERLETRRQQLAPSNRAQPDTRVLLRPRASPTSPVSAPPESPTQEHVRIRVVYDNHRSELTLTLDPGQLIRVGRDPQADVVVRSAHVSPFHCEIGIHASGIFVRDTNSDSGTFVAGARITNQTPLRDWEDICVGPAVIHLGRLVAQPSRSIDAIETPVSPSEAPPLDVAIAPSRVAPSNDARFAETMQAGIPLSGDLLTIGRDPACDLPLDDLVLSRRHAQLRRGADGWLVEDLGSTNGTFLNGQQLKRATLLKLGDLLRFGTHHFYFTGNHLAPRSE